MYLSKLFFYDFVPTELRLKLEIYEAEGQLDAGGATAAHASVAAKTLEGQNQRLKEALVLLRNKHDKTSSELDAVRATLMQQTTACVFGISCSFSFCASL